MKLLQLVLITLFWPDMRYATQTDRSCEFQFEPMLQTDQTSVNVSWSTESFSKCPHLLATSFVRLRLEDTVAVEHDRDQKQPLANGQLTIDGLTTGHLYNATIRLIVGKAAAAFPSVGAADKSVKKKIRITVSDNSCSMKYSDHTRSIQRATTVQTKAPFEPIKLQRRESNKLYLSWQTRPRTPVIRTTLHYREANRPDADSKPLFPSLHSVQGNRTYNFTIDRLRPNTNYDVWLVLIVQINGMFTSKYWPPNYARFSTLYGDPKSPEAPTVFMQRNTLNNSIGHLPIPPSRWKIEWKSPQSDGGAPIVLYRLEQKITTEFDGGNGDQNQIMLSNKLKRQRRYHNMRPEEWSKVYEGSKLQWTMAPMADRSQSGQFSSQNDTQLLWFRVRAKNAAGRWSAPSAPSKPIRHQPITVNVAVQTGLQADNGSGLEENQPSATSANYSFMTPDDTAQPIAGTGSNRMLWTLLLAFGGFLLVVLLSVWSVLHCTRRISAETRHPHKLRSLKTRCLLPMNWMGTFSTMTTSRPNRAGSQVSTDATTVGRDGSECHCPIMAQSQTTSLATLTTLSKQLPDGTYQMENILYQQASKIDTNAAATFARGSPFSCLPRFQPTQINLCKFLGSGQFGNVYEAELHEATFVSKVAIKILKRDHSARELSEFLKEALVMFSFNNEHIVRMLGVCIDEKAINGNGSGMTNSSISGSLNDATLSHSIVLELLQGGDLLAFLRNARHWRKSPVDALSIADLIGICLQVAKGCEYLERIHFVHRDIAARNCLVSDARARSQLSITSGVSHGRTVKLSDFGMARDVYRNDYYRKREGERLVPVRWMPPEALDHGVHTTKSDIWSFGVLMYEVFSLGQQPYTAQSNVEVWRFVRAGGRLERPAHLSTAAAAAVGDVGNQRDNISHDLYRLMSLCWHQEPNLRPTFSFIKETLATYSQSLAASSAVATSMTSTGQYGDAASQLNSNCKLRPDLTH